MNYLAHGRLHLDDPYRVAGTAAPDWMNVVARRARLRRPEILLQAEDPQAAAFARGVAAHQHDDRWFHGSRAFVELNLQFTVEIRDAVGADRGLRPGFAGHVLVELLLDAELARRDPGLLERYYATLQQAVPERLQRFAEQIATRPFVGLDRFVRLFLQDRFLYDYARDERLLWRMNRVLRRVGLQPLPETVLPAFARARGAVADRADELLTPPPSDDPRDPTRPL